MSWQPIKSAPKDGTDVLLFYPNRNRNVWIGSYDVSEHSKNGKISFRHEGWNTGVMDFPLRPTTPDKEMEPTHWMPLPQEPSAPAKAA